MELPARGGRTDGLRLCGALEWGALTHAVDYADVDHGWTATNAQSASECD